jgi:glutamate racemase
MSQASQAIGIFDSGIGGLTVAHAVAQQLPHENIIYFGDTAHLPYGDKSAQTIQGYCHRIVDFLLSKNCKLILAACNSATAAAYQFLFDYIKPHALFMNVIDPVVDYVAQHCHDQTIGLIGTRQTVNSNIFFEKIMALPNQLELKSLATPLLVPLIEENFYRNDALVDQVLKTYFDQPELANIEMLILACTHYPILKSRISSFYQHRIPILDSAEITANALRSLLSEHHLLNQKKHLGRPHFYVSDLTEVFSQMANYFFAAETITLEPIAI